jgi:translocator protein
MQRYLSLLPFLAAVFAVSLSGALFRPGEWYLSLQKPSFTPPGWLFAPAWTVLYVFIAVAGWKLWQAAGTGVAFGFWVAQLLLNASWSWVMFGRHEIGNAMIVLCLMWLSIVGFIVTAWPASRTASLLFLPYLAWVTFAGALNFAIWRLNP